MCELVKLARARNKNDLACAEDRGLYFDADAADHAVQVIESFRHSKGEWEGDRFTLAKWQREDIVRPLFGWMRDDGTRRFRIAYIEIARRNGKSTLAAAIGNYLFLADGEPGAEVYTAATKRDQAKIVHEEAVRMVQTMQQEDTRFKEFVKIRHDNMNVPTTHSKYEPLSADSRKQDGLNVSGGILDEIHEHANRAIYDRVRQGRGSRRQPLLFLITTAGFDRTSLCWELHEYAIKVLKGIHDDDSFFAYIATLDEGDDWRSEKVWVKANPNLGVSCKVDYLREEVRIAKQSPATQNAVMRFNMNCWTDQDVRWLSMDVWDACDGEVKRSALRKLPCWGGLDLASTSDITAFVLVFPIDNVILILPTFWVPRDLVSKKMSDGDELYFNWVRDGFLKTTPGNMTDYGFVRKAINALGDEFSIQQIAVDRLFQGAQLAMELGQDGFDMIAWGQGFMSMAAPTLDLETRLLSGTVCHGGNPVLRWMADNMSVEIDAAGCMKPTKKTSKGKIDGIVGTIMALGLVNVREDKTSVYEKRGVLRLKR